MTDMGERQENARRSISVGRLINEIMLWPIHKALLFLANPSPNIGSIPVSQTYIIDTGACLDNVV